MKPIIKALNKCAFDIQFDYNSDSVVYEEKTEGYLFVFKVIYKKNISNYMEATHTNPKEFDIDFEILNITNLEIYFDALGLLDLTDKQIEQLTELILKKL